MRWMQWVALTLGLTAITQAQIVINEVVYDDTLTDDREFIELFNAGQTTIAPNSLTIENRDAGGVSVMTTLACPNVAIPPGGFYLLGNAAVPGVQQIIPINSLENDEEVIVLRDASNGAVLDTVTYETNRREVNFPVGLIEGAGLWGNHTSTDGTAQSWSRFRDGLDSGNNGRDFGHLPATPGASNVPVAVGLPYFQDFDMLFVQASVPGWSGSFVTPFVVDPTISGPVGAGNFNNPSPIIFSPQGGVCMIVMDPTGGGNMAVFASPAQADIVFEAYVYFAAANAPTATEFESWSIGVRGSTGSFHNHPAPFPNQGTQVSANGNTGVAWEYIATMSGGTLYFRDEGDGGQDDLTLGQISILPGVNDGWQRLRISCRGNLVEGTFGGVYGNPATGTTFGGRTGFTGVGSVYVGYRENLAINQSMRPLTLDAVSIAPASVDYQRPQDQADLTMQAVQGTGFEPAAYRTCAGRFVTLKLGTSLILPPYEAALTLSPLIPLSGGGLISTMGQIINVDLGQPSLFFFNGISAPFFLPLVPFELKFPLPAAPFDVSMQAIVLDGASPEGFVLSQGVEIETVSAAAAPCALTASDWIAIAPSITEFGCQFYAPTSGAAQPLVWINAPGAVSTFVNSIVASGGPEDPIPDDYALNLLVRTLGGEVYALGATNLASGLPGTLHFIEGSCPALPSLHGIIEASYGLTGFTSNEEKKKEKQAPAATAEEWKEEELIPKPVKAGPFTGITLIIYQDDPGDDFLKKYAEAKAASTGGEAFQANGLNSIINKLRGLYGQCKKVDCLILAVHGSPGGFRIGPQGTPFGGPTRVGRHEGQISPEAFGEAIQCYLGATPAIKLLSCSTALTENATTGNGGQSLQDIADNACVTITGSDQVVNWRKKPAPNPNCVREPKTHGNVWRAQKNNPPPTIITPATVPPAAKNCIDP